MTDIKSLIEKRNRLRDDLETAEREILEAETSAYLLHGISKALIERFVFGESIIISFGRYWWVDANGELLGIPEDDEIRALKRLEQKGVFVHVKH